MNADMQGHSVEDARRQLVAKVGENISIRRSHLMEARGALGIYQHGSRIGVLVAIDGSDDELMAKDIAMHVAASRPEAIDESQLSSELLQQEREIFIAQAKETGKPDPIIDKMVEGKMKKYIKEVTLVNQPFIKDPDQTVGQRLNSAKVVEFIRYEVGEGMQKREENFVKEVAAQAASAKS